MVMNFSPSRSSTHGVTGSIGWASASARISSKLGMLREPLEVAPGREDQPRFAALFALEHVRRADSQSAPAHSPSMTCGCQSPGGRAGDEEQGVEAAHGVEFRHPARERRQRRQVERQAGRDSSSAKRPVGDQRVAAAAARLRDRERASSPTGTAVSSMVSRIAATARRIDSELRASVAVGVVDAPAGKDQRAGGERHAFGALDHQQLGRAAGAVANDDQGRGGDRSSHRRLGVRAKKKPPAIRQPSSRDAVTCR